jgi:hypothetical protein
MGDIYAGPSLGELQYKTIVSFDTSSLPDGAAIVSATLKMTGGGRAGTNPLTTHGALYADIVSGSFNGNPALENDDFQAPATATQALTMSIPPAGSVVSTGTLNAAGCSAINKMGLTQLRLYFSIDDNDDNNDDWVGCYSGENGTLENRPTLQVTYQQ